MKFFRQAFSDGNVPSSSRIISAVLSLSAIGWITHVVLHTHALPGGVETAGITALTTSHYVANRITEVIGKKKDSQQ